MISRILAGLVAACLLVAFIAPVVIKLKDYALGSVVAVGLALMLVDLWQTLLQKRE
jgi:hypothetical protein